MMRHVLFGFGIIALVGGFYMKKQGADLFWAPTALGAAAMILHWYTGLKKKNA